MNEPFTLQPTTPPDDQMTDGEVPTRDWPLPAPKAFQPVEQKPLGSWARDVLEKWL